MSAIDLVGVRKQFGETQVVRGVDLAVPSGAFLSLLGPSGCGKTTLLRMLAGLETPSEGEIRIDGAVVNAVPPGARDIAMVFQSYALYPQMTVAQNIAYPLRKRGVPKGERAGRVAAVAEMLQLGPLLERKPRQLSGGQQQRVALGRALVREPRIFLLDEPLSNLDATLRSHMRAELIELHRRIGRTMVYVTHDQLEAMTMSTHIAVIDGGVVQQFGTPQQVYRRPVNRMVAGFIGTPAMAFVEGRVGEGGALTLAGTRVATVDAAPGATPVIGIRAEDVRLAEIGVPARVGLVEPIGHETLVRLHCDAGIVTARLPGDTAVQPGEQVHFTADAGRLHLFDPIGGERLTDPYQGNERDHG
ncbi:ABC transporter ATP-binding protein [Sphingomonas baiyangensis]|uniref:ABC transporter ATP-binding protein n=1 Tax=Sphingomonas baiyangensis TaxID=2572576 RepID=A0A4U1L1F3_9SPHN|nr:ABC transporter ATP-binding protein [Sphingomonas baiyangensis]TKD49990.1 ABC transporter ATP-binding protein [Sphingomonas baiyangensis]